MVRIIQSEYETLAAFRYSLRQFLHFSEKAAQLVRGQLLISQPD